MWLFPIAIFTIASMLQSTGYWVTVVLGNLFILGLEGAIVGIQTLRLEYYEGFSVSLTAMGACFVHLHWVNGKYLRFNTNGFNTND